MGYYLAALPVLYRNILIFTCINLRSIFWLRLCHAASNLLSLLSTFLSLFPDFLNPLLSLLADLEAYICKNILFEILAMNIFFIKQVRPSWPTFSKFLKLPSIL